MGKYEKKKKKSAARLAVWVLVCLIAAAALVLYVMPRVLYRMSGDAEPLPEMEVPVPATADSTTTPTQPFVELLPEVTVAPVDFPLKPEDGRLTLEQLFQFDGINPDCGGEAGNAIAAMLVTNTSGDFLDEARLTLTLADGQSIDFLIANLPAGKTAMAFSLDNTQLSADALCQTVDLSALWSTESDALPDGISVFVEGTSITVQNRTDRELSGLTIHCRDILDETYFGGKSHCYSVDTLPPGSSATLDAEDSILGLVEVVCVEIYE